MNKQMKRSAAALGCAALGAVVLAGPALAVRPDPFDGVQNSPSGQAARVRADLRDLREQAGSAPAQGPSSKAPSPVDLPLLQIGLGAVAVAAFAAGAAGMRRRPHGPQPV